MRWFSPLFQTTLQLNANCKFQCLGCQLSSQTSTGINQQSILNIKPRQHVNLIGGSLEYHQQSIEIIKFLAKKKCSLTLWSHHDFSNSWFLELRPFISEWIIFCPAVSANEFNLIMGANAFSKFISTITQLPSPTLSFTIRSMNIDHLPELHELAFNWIKRNCLILLYRQMYSCSSLVNSLG